MKIAFNPSTVAALITPPNNKDITFDLRGRNIFARGVKFQGTDTWRDIKINNVSIGSNTLDLRNGSNTTLTNTNGVVTINSTWRPVVDNLTSDSTTSSLSAKQGKVLKSLIDGKSDSGHNHDDRYLKLTGGTMQLGEGLKFHADENYFGTDLDARIISLLDLNGKICDGGLIIDERGTLDGKEYVTELLRIRDSEFKWKGSNILHSGNSNINGNTITINGSSLTVSKSDHTHAYLPLTGGTMTGNIAFSNSSYLLWNNGSYHQRIFLTDDSTADTAVFTFQQSSDSGVNWSNLMTIRDNGKVIANTFVGALYGNASTATKLTSSAGNAALPIYFSDGKPVACTASSIFSNLSNSGNNISVTVAGQNRTLTVGYATSAGYANRIASKGQLDSQEKIDNFITSSRFEYATFKTTESNNVGFVSNDGMILSIPFDSTSYGAQIAFDDVHTSTVKVRSKNRNWGNWYTLLHSGNYNNYAPSKTGIGASGTWGINISGNADTLDSYHANGLLTALSNSNNGISITVGGTTKSISNISVNYANSAGNADTLDGLDSTKFLRQVVVPNNTENDFNTFSNMTLTGRTDPTTGASLKNAPWSGSGPGGGYGVLTYLFSGGGYGTQMAWGYASNRIYIRNKYWGGSGVGAVWRTSWDTLALTSDIPTSLKNPNSLILKANGTTLAIYDGSSAKEANFTYANVGAASASHTHSNYVTDLGTSGNYLTWTKNGNTSNITIPYAGKTDWLIPQGFFSTQEQVDAFFDTVNYSLKVAYIGNKVFPEFSDGLVLAASVSPQWCHQIHMDDNQPVIHHRARSGDSWSKWSKLLDSSNYSSYAIPVSASCNKNWSYSGQSGQPTWLWGSNDGTNCYVWNPSNFSVNYAASAGSVAWDNVTGKPTMPSNITATTAQIVTISGSTVTVNASLDDYKTPGEFNIFGTSNGDYAKMYVQSGIGDAFNGARVITQTIKVTISHNTYAEICDVTRQYKSNAWSKWTVMYLGND